MNINFVIFSETLEFLTKTTLESQLHASTFKAYGKFPREFAMEVSISETSVPRCPCRVGKGISPVIPRDQRHHEPHPWTAATTAALVVLRRKHARTARKAWGPERGKSGKLLEDAVGWFVFFGR